MREVEVALRNVGLPGGMAAGAAIALERWNSVKDRGDLSVEEVIELLGMGPGK